MVWTPRILLLLFVGSLVTLSLDVFVEGHLAGDIALGPLVHNLPALVLLGGRHPGLALTMDARDRAAGVRTVVGADVRPQWFSAIGVPTPGGTASEHRSAIRVQLDSRAPVARAQPKACRCCARQGAGVSRFARLLVPLECSLEAATVQSVARALATATCADTVLVHVVGTADEVLPLQAYLDRIAAPATRGLSDWVLSGTSDVSRYVLYGALTLTSVFTGYASATSDENYERTARWVSFQRLRPGMNSRVLCRLVRPRSGRVQTRSRVNAPARNNATVPRPIKAGNPVPADAGASAPSSMAVPNARDLIRPSRMMALTWTPRIEPA